MQTIRANEYEFYGGTVIPPGSRGAGGGREGATWLFWQEGPAVNFVVIGSELCIVFIRTYAVHPPIPSAAPGSPLPRTHRDRNTHTSGPHVPPPPRPIPRRPPRRHLKDRSHPRLLQASVRRRPHRILLLCQDSHCCYRQELRKSSYLPIAPTLH